MRTYRGVDEQIYILLTLVLVGDWSASRTGCFTPRESAPGTHWIAGWVGPTTGPDDVQKKKTFDPTGARTPPLGHPTHSRSF
jgi:hypothetical protein